MRLRRQFLELLQSGLWGRQADACLFEGTVQWEALLGMARAQALLGIVFDGVETLPPRYRPAKVLYLRWCAAVAQVEQANEMLDQCTVEVIGHYRQGGLAPLLLKGQGIARCYLHPEHRQCGDVDVYLDGRHRCSRANEILGRQGAEPVSEESDHHTSFNYQGVMVENHLFIGKLCTPWANYRFQQFTRHESRRRLRMVDIDEVAVQLPSPTFDALYVFVHAFRHLILGGIGFRQLCDWCRLLHTERQNINYLRLRHELSRLGLLHAALVFRDLAVNYLGLSPDDLPIVLYPTDDKPMALYAANLRIHKKAKELLDEIFATGNFGQYDLRIAPRPSGYWSGKWYTFVHALHRCVRLYRLAPAEVLFQPLALIQGSLAGQWRRLTHHR